MVIYGEVLFLENALIGSLLLWMTKKLCHTEVSGKKLLLGASLCGLYSFTLFQIQIPWICALLEKLVFSMVLIVLCFDKKRYGLKLLVFYGSSFLLGGITMGIFGLMSVPAISANGSVYVEKMTFLHLGTGAAATLLILHLSLALIRDHRYELQTKRLVTIVYQGKKFPARGFLDTGNRLMDPETGLPVCLVSSTLWDTLRNDDPTLRWIRYRGATGSEGLLAVMEPDGIMIGETEGGKMYRTILGTSLEVEGIGQWDGCQVLINGCFSEDCMELGGYFVG